MPITICDKCLTTICENPTQQCPRTYYIENVSQSKIITLCRNCELLFSMWLSTLPNKIEE